MMQGERCMNFHTQAISTTAILLVAELGLYHKVVTIGYI